MERALRRAKVPVATSAGFSPHPKISYLGAASTGAASEAEYLELGLDEPMGAEETFTRLAAALPPGIDIVEIVEARGGSLAERVNASQWLVRLPGVDEAQLRTAVAAFEAADEVPVERVLKDGRRRLDARAPVVRVHVGADGGCAILELVVRHVTPAVRPDDVLTGLRSVGSLLTPAPPQVTRLAQGLLDESDPASGRLADPLGLDRGDSAGPR